ncbi:MAG: lysyl-tRNA synthetase, class, partial [Solirubrobacteraceae bacterium]|nr:lysyl-tRNA synthetase, class [Solirubrobacteraceae bacterium]
MPPSSIRPLSRRHAPLRERRPAAFLAPLAAVLTALTGLINVISALTPELADRIRELHALAPASEVMTADRLALPVGIALLLAAPYLWLRRRGALWAAVALLTTIGLLDLVKGIDWEEAAVSWMVAGVLVRWRAAFWVRHDPGHWAIALRDVASILLAAFGAAAILAAVGASVGIEELLGIAPFALVLWVAFRRPAAPEHDECRDDVARVVREHGSCTLSFFKLREDLHHLFSADRSAVLSYRVEGGVLLVAGDPLGPEEQIPGLLAEACSLAEDAGLRIGVVGASEDFAAVATAAGLRSLYIGDEAVVETAGFSLEGRKIKKVRQAVMRIERHGFTAELRRHAELTKFEIAELERVSACWRDGSPERGFSMALDSLHGDHLGDSWVVLARDGEGVVRGFLHYVPTYGRPAASLSFMRRERDTPNGVIDFLVVRSIGLLRDEGIEELSLNF